VQDLKAWLKDYHSGAIRFAKDGASEKAALDQVEHRMQLLAQANTLVAEKLHPRARTSALLRRQQRRCACASRLRAMYHGEVAAYFGV
jgi:hypothetical protein